MRIIAKTKSPYAQGTNKEIAQRFIDNIEGYFKHSFPNGTFNGGMRNTIGTDHIVFDFVLANPKVTPHNDPMYHSVIIQWGSNFGQQPKTLEELPALEFNVLSSGIAINPPKGSFMARGRVKTGLTNVKKNGSLDKFDKKMKTWFPKLRKILDENKDNLYGLDNIDPHYLK